MVSEWPVKPLRLHTAVSPKIILFRLVGTNPTYRFLRYFQAFLLCKKKKNHYTRWFKNLPLTRPFFSLLFRTLLKANKSSIGKTPSDFLVHRSRFLLSLDLWWKKVGLLVSFDRWAFVVAGSSASRRETTHF